MVAPGAASAATFTVTKTADTNGPPCVVADPDCSLREAIEAANANGTGDAINFAGGVTGTVALDAAFGHLEVRNESLDIQGPGAGQLTINGGAHDRIFKLFGFNAEAQQVVISGLTMTNGLTNDDGGAILSLDGSPTQDDDFDFGFPADLTVADSAITDSVADRGGGIALEVIDSSSSGGLTIRNTTVDGNDAQIGGGVFATQVGRDITVTASTFSNNTAVVPIGTRAAGTLVEGDGGGLAIDRGEGEVLVENSTFARNHADSAGGAIRFVSDVSEGPNPRAIHNTTIADNSAAEGGGISVSRFSREQERGLTEDPLVGLSSTIVADNTASAAGDNSDGPDLHSDDASFNAGFSLLEVTDGATVTEAPPGSNITGQDPQLGALAGNGGPTETKLPATASPAIDAGVANGLATEQRGTARTVDRPAANANDGTDIGAVELPLDASPYDELPGPKETRCLGEPLLVKRGGENSERLEGTPQRDGIFAHGGRDTVLGLQADDCLFGGEDEDLVKGGPNDDHVAGDPADDSVHGNGGRDDARGQHGDDKVFGGAGGDKRVTGGTGDDRVFGGAGDDNLIKGDGGNDYLDLGSGNDFVHAGGGKDEIHAADGDVDEIVCGTGHDVAFVDPGDTVLPDCNKVHVVR